jgi:hypothetical protein
MGHRTTGAVLGEIAIYRTNDSHSITIQTTTVDLGQRALVTVTSLAALFGRNKLVVNRRVELT